MDNAKQHRVLVINPGSTSTKIAVYAGETVVCEKTVRHSTREIERFEKVWDQYEFRKRDIVAFLRSAGIELSGLDAVVGRGGLLKPLESGTYRVDQHMIDHLRIGIQGQHASNLGGVLAYGIGWDFALPSFIVDPVAVDEFEPISRVSGLADIQRGSLFHALNIKATARKAAKELGRPLSEVNLIIAHLGGGITVAAMKKGRVVDVNNGIGEGPFSPERAGYVHTPQLVDLCFSGKFTQKEIMKKIAGKGGLVSYLGTSNAAEVEDLIKAGHAKAKLVYEAMAYQIAREIAARAVTLSGKFDLIVLTGGLAHSDMLTRWIEERCGFLGPIKRYPGEDELEALAAGALRVLRGEEVAKTYDVQRRRIGIVYHQMHALYDASIQILEGKVRDAGYRFRETDENLEIVHASLKGRKPEQVYEELRAKGVGVIVTIGSPAAAAMKPFIKGGDTPVVCIACFDPVVMGLAASYATSGNNVTGSSYRVDAGEQLRKAILPVVPGLKRLGVVYQSGELQSEIQLDEVRAASAAAGLTVLAYDAQSPDELDAAADYFLAEGAEAVFLVSDSASTFADERALEKLTGALPTAAALGRTVRAGALVGRIARWEDVSARGADMVLRVLEGATPSSIPIYRNPPIETVVNRGTLRRLGLEGRADLLAALGEVVFHEES